LSEIYCFGQNGISKKKLKRVDFVIIKTRGLSLMVAMHNTIIPNTNNNLILITYLLGKNMEERKVIYMIAKNVFWRDRIEETA
jgi:hypothetical protein